MSGCAKTNTPRIGPPPSEGAIRVTNPNASKEAFAKVEKLIQEHSFPVVIEFIIERVTNIATGTEIDAVSEFEDIVCLDPSPKAENNWVPAVLDETPREIETA